MSRALKIYITIILLLLAAIVVVELSTPPPTDWRVTFQEDDKNPFGSYIIYNELQNLFPEAELEEIIDTPYEHFDQYYDWGTEEYNTSGTYMYIDGTMLMDEFSAQELLDFASYGNDIFISSTSIPFKLIDSLGFSVETDFNFQESSLVNLEYPDFASDSLRLNRAFTQMHFSDYDTETTDLLGYREIGSVNIPNYIRVSYGEGNFYVHLEPIIFTNYYLLKDDNYAEAVLSYLNPERIFYDTRRRKRQNLGSSQLRFILNTPALRWGFYSALLALLLFMIFNAKRKQRVVPVIKPLTNTTVDFTKTIANLYYETKDHNAIIDKKITFFLEYLRRVYFLDTSSLDDKFISTLSSKSGKKVSLVNKLINLITYLRSKSICTEDDLLNLNKLIEEFLN